MNNNNISNKVDEEVVNETEFERGEKQNQK